MGGFGFVCPVPGMWACGLFRFKFAFPGLWVLFCLVVCDGCARMWVFGIYVSGDFCFGLMPLFLSFRGGPVRFSFFLGAFFGFVCILFWWALAFW